MSTTPDTGRQADARRRDAMLAVFANLSRYHREHEKYHSEAPLHEAAALQRISRTLKALAERWSAPPHADARVASPFAGAADLNDERAIETSGVLFMESGEVPGEIERIKRELETMAANAEATGTWLAGAMEASWDVAAALIEFAELADLLAERHSIIANDWQNASTLLLISRQLRRANLILEHLDLTVTGIRAEIARSGRVCDYVFSCAELVDHAADLTDRGAILVHQNERRWRIFHARVSELLDADA